LNNNPITILIPLVSYGGADHIKKSEQDLFMVGYFLTTFYASNDHMG